MATPQLSPGVLVREVDLTVGRADNVLDNIGAIAGPFKIGPVNDPIDVTNEQELIKVFGKPISTDAQYEYWLSAASYLSYGGVLKVCRAGATTLANANVATDAAASSGAGTGIGYTTALAGTSGIENYDDYLTNHSSATNFLYAAKNPGTWANSMKVCFIDDFADQTLGITTDSLAGAGATVGYGVTMALSSVNIPGTGSTESFSGYLKGIITGVTTDSTNEASTVDVKIVARVSTAGIASAISYEEGTAYGQFSTAQVSFCDATGAHNSDVIHTPTSATDWYDAQTLGLTNSTVYWKSIADRPSTGKYTLDRSGKNDGVHIVVVDDTGSVTGIQGNILESHLHMSKAKDSVSSVNSPQKNYYKDYLADFSENIYAGGNPGQTADAYKNTTPVSSGFTTAGNFTATTVGSSVWGLDAQSIQFNVIGNVDYTLNGGVDYTSTNGMTATLANLITAYGKFENKNEVEVDYLIMGPGLATQGDSQAKANYLLSIAGQRKDCVATIGPHRSDLIGITNTETQTENVLNFFSPLQSSSNGVFDSGYKYMYDRFNNEFRADIFLKPAKSINYVTLTFVATRTGVSFEEVVGRV